ncbi:MAG: ribbon-helix-helix domain-containing protein [Bifidobacteriaceae bacterium]|jgi:hypothetical protein|nr:ribbon-helix-helix domain-containing protein [Bifidobacteriaceae bacterium]
MSDHYEELADRAERGLLTVKPGTVLRGRAAAQAGRRDLLAATGASTLQEATRIALGRPPVGGLGPSPVVHARVPRALKESLTELAAREHRRESEVVREALATYIDARSPVG